jgi:hypothetical protein
LIGIGLQRFNKNDSTGSQVFAPTLICAALARLHTERITA